jgi:Ni,Fe-hydrogenase I cytochrome b subunit
VVVRVWDLPVRLIHWLLVATIVVLSVTGFYIGTPTLWAGGGSSAYLMGKMHAVHIAAGWAFTALLIARVAWMFLGAAAGPAGTSSCRSGASADGCPASRWPTTRSSAASHQR